MEEARSLSLLQFITNEGLVPSPEEELRRKNAIDKLKQIVMQWIKRVGYQRRLPKQYVAAVSATILTYGSYGLGNWILMLCVGPCFATMADDFFIVLHNMLTSRPEVSEVHCVKDAKVLLMRFKFDGLSIDLPYAQLEVTSVPENVDILNPFFLRNIDETSGRSLSGVCANKRIFSLFQTWRLQCASTPCHALPISEVLPRRCHMSTNGATVKIAWQAVLNSPEHS